MEQKENKKAEKKCPAWIYRDAKKDKYRCNSNYRLFAPAQTNSFDLNIVKAIEINRQIFLRLGVVLKAKEELEDHYEYRSVRSFRIRAIRERFKRNRNFVIAEVIDFVLMKLYGYKWEELEALR